MSEYWTEPALRAPARRPPPRRCACRTPCCPTASTPYEAQEAYRALKGHALRIEMYADGRIRRRPPTLHGHRAELHRPPRAASGPNLHAVFFVASARDADLSLRAGRGRPAGQPRADPGDRRVRQRAAAASRSATRAAPGYPPPEPALPAAAQAMLAYDQTRLHIAGPSTATPTPIDDLATGPDAYRAPLPAPSTRPRSPASRRAGARGRDHRTCSRSARSTGPAGSGQRPGAAADIAYEQVPRVRCRRDRDPGRRADPPVRRAAAGPLPRRRPVGAAAAR